MGVSLERQVVQVYTLMSSPSYLLLLLPRMLWSRMFGAWARMGNVETLSSLDPSMIMKWEKWTASCCPKLEESATKLGG